jgi:hypothetical protein
MLTNHPLDKVEVMYTRDGKFKFQVYVRFASDVELCSLRLVN